MGWQVAAKVLSGADVTMTYPEGNCINVVLDADVAVPEGEFGVTVPMSVPIGERTVDLGTFEVWLSDPVLVERRPYRGGTHFTSTTPGRTVRYRRSSEPRPGFRSCCSALGRGSGLVGRRVSRRPGLECQGFAGSFSW